jgi:hypothetical protein
MQRYAYPLILFLFSSYSYADILIDSFSTPQSATVNGSSLAVGYTVTTSGTDIFGQQRAVVVAWLSGGGDASLKIANDSFGLLDFSQESRVTSKARLIWGGSPAYLSDLTAEGNNAFAIDVIASEQPITLTFSVVSYPLPGSPSVSEKTISLVGGAADIKTLYVPFAEFASAAGYSAADFTSASGIILIIDAQNAPSADLSLDNFRATNFVEAPEPGVMTTFATPICAGVVVFWRRKCAGGK